MDIVYIILAIILFLFGLAIVLDVYGNDAVEREPMRLMAALYLAGVLLVIPIIFAEKYMQDSVVPDIIEIDSADESWIFYLANAFLVAALVEEGFKFLVLFCSTWWNKNFDYAFDGIVYGVTISIGMATSEYLYHMFFYGLKSVSYVFGRLYAIPGHAMYGVIMGYFYGKTKKSMIDRKYGKATIYIAATLLCPILLHGLWDFLASFELYGLILVCFLCYWHLTSGIKERTAREDWAKAFHTQTVDVSMVAFTERERKIEDEDMGTEEQDPTETDSHHEVEKQFEGFIELNCPTCGEKIEFPFNAVEDNLLLCFNCQSVISIKHAQIIDSRFLGKEIPDSSDVNSIITEMEGADIEKYAKLPLGTVVQLRDSVNAYIISGFYRSDNINPYHYEYIGVRVQSDDEFLVDKRSFAKWQIRSIEHTGYADLEGEQCKEMPEKTSLNGESINDKKKDRLQIANIAADTSASYPPGTIVMLKKRGGKARKLMLLNKKESDGSILYRAVNYPVGLLPLSSKKSTNPETVNHKDIRELLHMGYFSHEDVNSDNNGLS